MKKMFAKDTSARLESKGKPIALAEFSPIQKKTGVTVKVKRRGKRALITHAFTSGKPSPVYMRYYRYKHEGPYRGMREGFPYASLPLKYRYRDKVKLRTLTGPRIQDIYANPIRFAKVIKLTEGRMIKEAERLLEVVKSGKMVL